MEYRSHYREGTDMIAGWNLPSLPRIIGILFLITCISFIIGGLVAIIYPVQESETGMKQTTPISAPKNDIEKAMVSLEIEEGSINLSAGSHDELMRGTVQSWNSRSGQDLVLSRSGTTGILTLKQKSSIIRDFISNTDEWNLTLSRDISVDLVIRCGAGNLKVDAKSLNLTSLSIEAGSGEIFVDISSFAGKHIPVSVEAGFGSVWILLPPDCSVAAETEKGFGTRSVSGLEGSNGMYYSKSDSPERRFSLSQ